MSASEELTELRASLMRATTELAAAAERLESLERETGAPTVIIRRWRSRDSAVAAAASLGTAVLIGLISFALPAKTTEPAPQALVVPQPPPSAATPVIPPPEPVVVQAPEPLPVVAEPPEPPRPRPPHIVRPVVAAKPAPSDAPDPFRVHVRERHEASDVF